MDVIWFCMRIYKIIGSVVRCVKVVYIRIKSMLVEINGVVLMICVFSCFVG